jgi:hypothetical protein
MKYSSHPKGPLMDLETQAVAAEKAITRYVKRYAETIWEADGAQTRKRSA